MDEKGTESGSASLRKLGYTHPPTVVVETPSGGKQYWYANPASWVVKTDSTGKLAPAVDVLGEDAAGTLPPSTYYKPPHGPYRWMEGRSPAEIKIAPLPKGLRKLLTDAGLMVKARTTEPPPKEKPKAKKGKTTPRGAAQLQKICEEIWTTPVESSRMRDATRTCGGCEAERGRHPGGGRASQSQPPHWQRSGKLSSSTTRWSQARPTEVNASSQHSTQFVAEGYPKA